MEAICNLGIATNDPRMSEDSENLLRLHEISDVFTWSIVLGLRQAVFGRPRTPKAFPDFTINFTGKGRSSRGGRRAGQGCTCCDMAVLVVVCDELRASFYLSLSTSGDPAIGSRARMKRGNLQEVERTNR